MWVEEKLVTTCLAITFNSYRHDVASSVERYTDLYRCSLTSRQSHRINYAITVLKIVIWGGKSSVLWSEISFNGDAPAGKISRSPELSMIFYNLGARTFRLSIHDLLILWTQKART